ncbi:MAG: dihydrolipoyl dehydrogenase family protein [Anaerolineae bacterium]
MVTENYDFVVIGAGSGGLTAAEFAAQLGVKVALVEKGRIGGDCTWTGCVPSKALLHVAKMAHHVRTADRFGVITSLPEVNMTQVRAYLQRAINTVYQQETAEILAGKGIDVVEGVARFLDPHTIQAGERTLKAGKVLITTGARPFIPPIPGIEEVPYVTHEQLFDNERLPQRLLVLGAGPIGMEAAQAYRRLGARVTIVDVDLLPREEPEASAVMKRVFAREGVECVIGLASAVTRKGGEILLTVNDQQIRGDMLLVAVGRRPHVEGLALDKAGVTYTARDGIRIDRHGRTSARHIYAAGDCVGGHQFTHFAGWQAFQAARNALLPGSDPCHSDIVPWVTFTDPEVAHVGLTAMAARKEHGASVRVTLREIGQIDRAITDGVRDGFIKLVHGKRGKLLGATIVAPNAGEMIAEFATAMQHGLKIDDLARVIHVYPTFSMGVQQAAYEVATNDFIASTTGKLVRLLVGNKAK